MTYRVLSDGSIVADTPEEAVALAKLQRGETPAHPCVFCAKRNRLIGEEYCATCFSVGRTSRKCRICLRGIVAARKDGVCDACGAKDESELDEVLTIAHRKCEVCGDPFGLTYPENPEGARGHTCAGYSDGEARRQTPTNAFLKAVEEAKAKVLTGTWDPPSGTWYFHCACPNIRRENSGIVASIRGARCARCGVCADRPAHPEAITATLIGSGETDESSLATAIQREIVQTLSTLPKRAWDGGEAPQPAASTPIAFVATIEQRPPGKNVSLDPKVVDSGFSSSTDLPTTAATMATIVSLTRVDGDYFPSKNYILYVENPIGVRHAHLAPFSDYDEGCKGCHDPKAIEARKARWAKSSEESRHAASDHEDPAYDSCHDLDYGMHLTPDLVVRLKAIASRGGWPSGVTAITAEMLVARLEQISHEDKRAQELYEETIRDLEDEQSARSDEPYDKPGRPIRPDHIALKETPEPSPRVGLIGEERHVTGTDCCMMERCEQRILQGGTSPEAGTCGARLHRGQAPGAQGTVLCEVCDGDHWKAPELAKADASATPGTPGWWASFHKEHGRDPTPAEMSAAARPTKGAIPVPPRTKSIGASYVMWVASFHKEHGRDPTPAEMSAAPTGARARVVPSTWTDKSVPPRRIACVACGVTNGLEGRCPVKGKHVPGPTAIICEECAREDKCFALLPYVEPRVRGGSCFRCDREATFGSPGLREVFLDR